MTYHFITPQLDVCKCNSVESWTFQQKSVTLTPCFWCSGWVLFYIMSLQSFFFYIVLYWLELLYDFLVIRGDMVLVLVLVICKSKWMNRDEWILWRMKTLSINSLFHQNKWHVKNENDRGIHSSSFKAFLFPFFFFSLSQGNKERNQNL